MSEAKEVLLVYNDRKRPVEFRTVPGNPSAEQKNLYNAVERVFADVFSTGGGLSSSSQNHEVFYLQFECEEWGGEMVDITGSVVVPSKSIVYLRKPLNKDTTNVRLCHS